MLVKINADRTIEASCVTGISVTEDFLGDGNEVTYIVAIHHKDFHDGGHVTKSFYSQHETREEADESVIEATCVINDTLRGIL